MWSLTGEAVLSLREGLLDLIDRSSLSYFLSLYGLFRAEIDNNSTLQPLLTLEPASICGSRRSNYTLADCPLSTQLSSAGQAG